MFHYYKMKLKRCSLKFNLVQCAVQDLLLCSSNFYKIIDMTWTLSSVKMMVSCSNVAGDDRFLSCFFFCFQQAHHLFESASLVISKRIKSRNSIWILATKCLDFTLNWHSGKWNLGTLLPKFKWNSYFWYALKLPS